VRLSLIHDAQHRRIERFYRCAVGSVGVYDELELGLCVFVVDIAPDEGWVAFIGARVEFEIFIKEKAAFFVRYDKVSQSWG